MKIIFLAGLFFIQNVFAACGIDKVLDYKKTYDYESCTTVGYCTMYDYNPATGQNETYYGGHNSCPGRYEIAVENYRCERAPGNEYTDVDESRVSGCKEI